MSEPLPIKDKEREHPISIGAWGDGSEPADRRAFGVDCQLLENGPAFMLIDAQSLPWTQEHLGTPLTRTEALSDERKAEVFSILDRLLEEESRFREFLSAGLSPSS